MKKTGWKKKIKSACVDVGTYKPSFDTVIETLAEILEKRDAAQEQFQQTGGNPVIVHTNKAGAKNLAKNPALQVWDDMNKTALQYWRDLGLTPAGLRRINEEALKEKQTSFADALRGLEL